MTKNEALKLALEALEYLATQIKPDYEHNKAIIAIKAALEAKDEPVAFRLKSETVDYQVTCYSKEQADIYINDMGWQLIEVLYTTPPQRKPLTDEEINALDYSGTRIEFVRAIEAAHGIKGEA